MRLPGTRVGMAAALAGLLTGCAPLGVGVSASNRGASVGLSSGVPLPTVNAPRDSRIALPPPRLIDPAETAADTPASAVTRKTAP